MQCRSDAIATGDSWDLAPSSSASHSLPAPVTVTPCFKLEGWPENSQSYFNDMGDLSNSKSKSSSASNTAAFSVIDKIATFISAFSFEKARELAVKHSTQKSTDPNLSLFLVTLINIANTERQYLNLSFLAPKGFLRKDCNLKGILEQIRQDLKKFAETEYLKYSSELSYFVTMRLELIEFYSKLSLLGSSKNVEVIDLISDLEFITEKFADGRKQLAEGTIDLYTFFTSLSWEIEILTNLLQSHVSMQNWEYYNSIIGFQEAQKCLSDWTEYLQEHEFSKKSSFLSPGSGGPVLYDWLFKLKATLLSKFSLYFYEILVQHSNPAYDIRLTSAKLQMDYFSRINSFLKKSDALCVCLVFDARLSPFHPNGYQHPARPVESPKGIDSFPSVFAVPAKPATHWPSVVMLITGRIDELNADKFVGFFDSSSKVQATFFLQRIDTRMYLLTLYECKKSEKDSYVMKFMQELATDLKCGKIFGNLKLLARS